MTIERAAFAVWVEITPGNGYTMRTRSGSGWEIVDDPDPAADPEEVSMERLDANEVAAEIRARLVGRDLDHMWKITDVWAWGSS